MKHGNSPLSFWRLALILCAVLPCSRADCEETLDDLLRVEAKVQKVVSKVMPTVVAVTDGQGFGSGVIVSSDGLVLTAGHVMASPFKRAYRVIFPDGRSFKAEPLGKNLNVDAGMVQITEPGPFPFVDVADKDAELGQWVVTLGHSGGYDMGRKPPIRTGRVLRRRGHQVVTDAVLIGGDSGGPLFNLEGEVIGIHSSIGDSIAENRHVTVGTFRKHWTRMASREVWGQLPELASSRKKRAPVKRARMGVVVDRDADNALVTQVHLGSPADKAGLRTGDVITRFDDTPIRDSGQLIDLIKTKQPGNTFSLRVERNGFLFSATVTLEEF